MLQLCYITTALDKYTSRAIHCRYYDIYPLWNEVHITSVYSPEDIYKKAVKLEERGNDTFKQLIRRLDVIVFHYIENCEYKEFPMPAKYYINYEDLKNNAKMNTKYKEIDYEKGFYRRLESE